MQTRGSTNKSPIKLSAAENKLTWWFVYEWGKPIRQKPHRVILRLPFSKFYYYYNKQLQVKESQYLILTYSWTIPNIQLDLFCSDNFSFWCTTPSTWLINCTDPSTRLQSPTKELKKVVGCKVFQFIPTMKIKKMLGHKSLRCTNTATSSQEQWIKVKLCLQSQITWTNFAQHLCNLCPLWRPLK